MRLSWLALLVPAALALAGGTIIAAHAGDGTTTSPTIHACAQLKDGRLRVSPPDGPAGTTNAHSNGTSRASAATPARMERSGPPGLQARPGRSVPQDRQARRSGRYRPTGTTRTCRPARRPGRERTGRPRRPDGPGRSARRAGRNRLARPGWTAGPRGRGITSLEDLNGLACNAGGEAGTVALRMTARHAVLTWSRRRGRRRRRRRRARDQDQRVLDRRHRRRDERVRRARQRGLDRDRHRRLQGRLSLGERKLGHHARDDSRPARPSRPAPSTCSAEAATRERRPPTSRSGPSIAATGGSLGVRDGSDGTLLDAVAYGTAANGLGEGQPATAPPTTASPGSSAIRLPDGHDTDNNAADFSVTDDADPKGGKRR